MKYQKINKNKKLPRAFIQNTVCLKKLSMPRKMLWNVNEINKYYLPNQKN